MSTSITAEQHFDAPPAEVFTMLCDPDYITEKLTASGGSNLIVASDPTDDGGARLRLDRRLPAKLPSVARRFVGESVELDERHTWGPATGDGGRVGHFRATAPGTPLVIAGTLHLSPDGSGTVIEVRGDCKAGVPFVSGKIEAVVVDWTVKFLRKEEQVAADWLAREP